MNKNRKLLLPALGMALLTNCTGGPTSPDGAILLDEDVTLEREAKADVAHREIPVDGDSVIVAFVDETLTNVRVRLAIAGSSDEAAVEKRRTRPPRKR